MYRVFVALEEVSLESMDSVAGGASNAMLIHHALYKVIALYPVLVGGSICEMRKTGLS